MVTFWRLCRSVPSSWLPLGSALQLCQAQKCHLQHAVLLPGPEASAAADGQSSHLESKSARSWDWFCSPASCLPSPGTALQREMFACLETLSCSCLGERRGQAERVLKSFREI